MKKTEKGAPPLVVTTGDDRDAPVPPAGANPVGKVSLTKFPVFVRTPPSKDSKILPGSGKIAETNPLVSGLSQSSSTGPIGFWLGSHNDLRNMA